MVQERLAPPVIAPSSATPQPRAEGSRGGFGLGQKQDRNILRASLKVNCQNYQLMRRRKRSRI